MMLWLPPLALLLDLVLADPKRLPHPVQGVGFLAEVLEKHARRLGHPLIAGFLAMLLLLAIVGGGAAILTALPWGLGTVAAVYLAWSGLALGGLVRESTLALEAVGRAMADPAALPPARHAVQMLVSRDTSAMHADDLCRSLAETVSENFNDAFVAPYFWLCIGGPVTLWMYKGVSTLDSMWGYTSERWLYFGRAAARLDDVLAYVPARLSALLLWLAAWLGDHVGWRRSGRFNPSIPRPIWPGYRLFRDQAGRSASPNAGWPMAAAAWIFHGQTGGPTVYHGRVTEKPRMGPEDGNWELANTAALIRHVRLAGILAGVLAGISTLALASVMPGVT